MNPESGILQLKAVKILFIILMIVLILYLIIQSYNHYKTTRQTNMLLSTIQTQISNNDLSISAYKTQP